MVTMDLPPLSANRDWTNFVISTMRNQSSIFGRMKTEYGAVLVSKDQLRFDHEEALALFLLKWDY